MMDNYCLLLIKRINIATIPCTWLNNNSNNNKAMWRNTSFLYFPFNGSLFLHLFMDVWSQPWMAPSNLLMMQSKMIYLFPGSYIIFKSLTFSDYGMFIIFIVFDISDSLANIILNCFISFPSDGFGHWKLFSYWLLYVIYFHTTMVNKKKNNIFIVFATYYLYDGVLFII